MFKNTAATFIVFAFDHTTGAPKTGDAANITAYVSKDYGAVTVLGDTTATEMDATNAKGYYSFTAAQAETDADCLMISAKSSTANVSVIGAPAVIYTRPQTGWLAPATPGRTLVVDAAGLADANVVKVGPSGAGTAQTAGDIIGDTNDIQARLPAALVSGRMDSSVGAMAANVITAASIAADAITDAKVASDVTIASVTGAVGSVTGLTASDVAAIKAKTDSLTFTVAGQVDANVQAVNDVALQGDGTAGNSWRPV